MKALDWIGLLNLLVLMKRNGTLPTGEVTIHIPPAMLSDLWDAILTIRHKAPCEMPVAFDVIVNPKTPNGHPFIYDSRFHDFFCEQLARREANESP